MDNYLSNLNEQQREAVEYVAGPQLVIAGAGSGKTRVLTYKIVHLLNNGYRPHQILALTFTNKAAKEMRERISTLVGASIASKLWMGTFHSIFAKILRYNASYIGFKSNFTVYDTYDSLQLIKHIIKELGLDEKQYKASSVLNRISIMKNALYTPSDYAQSKELMIEDERCKKPQTALIYKLYWERCKRAGAMDFDDLLFYTNILFRDVPEVLAKYQNFFKTILIDEYQDTNFAQDSIVYQLAKEHQSIFAVGDDAQSIYSFRGANINNILTLTKRYPTLKVFKLEQNYRSTQNITFAANSLIEKNSAQIKKSLFSDNPLGSKIKIKQFISDYDEAFYIANEIVRLKQRFTYGWNDFAVLYRTNAQSRILERTFSSGGAKDTHGNTRMPIPYRIYGGTAFYQRKEVKDAVSYFRLVLNHDDEEALRRVINYPKRGIGQTTVGKLQQAATAHSTSIWGVLSSPEFYGVKLTKGTLFKLREFKELIDSLTACNENTADAYSSVSSIISKTGLIEVLANDNTPENVSRVQNLEELVASAELFVKNQQELEGGSTSLSDFMAEVSLATDQDQEADGANAVTLMTVHAAKGLEFSNVVIFGVENDFFPSSKSQSTLSEIEEERRLLYVAITRAKDNCIITHAQQHTINGKLTPANPSPFINDIDPKYVDRILTHDQSLSSQPTSFGSGRFINKYASSSDDTKAKVTTSKPHLTPVSQIIDRRSRVEPSAVTADGFATHSVSELYVGQTISHQRFGIGVIKEIDTSSDHKIVVDFENTGKKNLLLAFAKFKLK